jgi:hypothetical protein
LIHQHAQSLPQPLGLNLMEKIHSPSESLRAARITGKPENATN